MRALFATSALLGAAALAAPAAIAPLAPAGLAVDGDLSDWNPGLFSVAPPTFFGASTSFLESGAVRDDADQSAQLYFAVGRTELLVGVLVRDDSVVTVRHGDLWQGDTVELLFPRKGGPMLHVGVNAVGDVHVFSTRLRRSETSLRAAAQLDPDGWVVELAIPLDALDLAPGAGSLPMNLAMRDVDAQRPAPAYRVWSGQRHGQAASAGRLLLDRAARPAVSWPTCPAPTKTVKLSAPLRARGKTLQGDDGPVVLRLVNYQSARRSWQDFWTDFDLAQVRADLELARRLRINAVRLFVFTEAFGEEQLRPEFLDKLRQVVAEAGARGMVSVVTFFPFKKEFRPEWEARMQRHLEAVVRAFRGDPRIAMWDLMNEPDHAWALDGGTATVAQVGRWTRRMYAAVKDADPTHLVTVGLAGHWVEQPSPSEDAELPFVEVASVHWYGDEAKLDETFARLAKTPRPLVLQEFGATSLYFTEPEAAAHYGRVCAAAKQHGFAGVGAWELFDHPVGSISHQRPRWTETVENDFGLLTVDGRPRQQAGVFCRCLDAVTLRLP